VIRGDDCSMMKPFSAAMQSAIHDVSKAMMHLIEVAHAECPKDSAEGTLFAQRAMLEAQAELLRLATTDEG
jgi:hypothetical protein